MATEPGRAIRPNEAGTTIHRPEWRAPIILSLLAASAIAVRAGGVPPDNPRTFTHEGQTWALYPTAFSKPPPIPSPCRAENGIEVVTVCTERNDYALIPVTLVTGTVVPPWEAPLAVDGEDFPTLAATGRHSDAELARTRTVTGRWVEAITSLGRPGGLSASGFLAEDEDLVSVLRGDNRRVIQLGLTHVDLARPLIHVCNLIRVLYRETGRRHTNDVFYGGHRLSVEVEFSRGGQQSIFNDGLDGAWTIRLRRELADDEAALLHQAYAHLDPTRRTILIQRLAELMTGELQPFYIYCYGFYEGHTAWRTDPITLAFLFGLKRLKDIEAAWPGRLDAVLTEHFVCRGEP